MFHKPFRVKSNSAVKGSERRKTRAQVEAQFRLDSETASQIIPNKEEMTTAKLVTHGGVVVNVHLVNKNPVLIDDRGTLYPTVMLLWQFPDLLPRFRTWEPVYHKLCGGADLMLPGVVLKGAPSVENLHGVKKNDAVAIHVAGNAAPVAVAYATMGAQEMLRQGMRGKGCVVVHTANDELFKFGKDKPKIPSIPDLVPADADDDANTFEDEGKVDDATEMKENRESPTIDGDRTLTVNNEKDHDDTVQNSKEEDANVPQKQSVQDRQSPDRPDDGQPSSEAPDEEESLVGQIADILIGNDDRDEDGIVVENAEASSVSPSSTSPLTTPDVVSMDDCLEFYAKIVIRFRSKAVDFPMTTQAFYKRMQSACPEEDALDVRRSSFKKPLKFFQELQLQGILKLKEEAKGVWMVAEVAKGSPLVRGMDLEALPYVEQSNQSEEEEDDAAFRPPAVKEMLSINAAVLPLFRDAGLAKGSGVSAPEMRRVVTEYLRANELIKEDDKARIKLNPELANIVLEKGENDVIELTWNVLFQRISKKMGQCYSLEYAGQPVIFKKGGLPPIALNVETRSGNKKVTTVSNLEPFGVDPRELAREVRVRAAASASVSSAPGLKAGSKQLVVQGNQINLIVAILTEKYNLEKKHINGMEKGEKKKKR